MLLLVLLPFLPLLPLPILADGATGLLSTAAGGGRTKDAEPDDITAPIPKISRGFLASPEPLRFAARDAVPVLAPVPFLFLRFATMKKGVSFCSAPKEAKLAFCLAQLFFY